MENTYTNIHIFKYLYILLHIDIHFLVQGKHKAYRIEDMYINRTLNIGDMYRVNIVDILVQGMFP